MRADKTYTVALTNEGVERISEDVREFLRAGDLERQEANATWLEFDNALVMFKEHFGEQAEATVTRNRIFGSPRLYVRVPGEQFNPLKEPTLDDWQQMLDSMSQRHPIYAYRGGKNSLAIAQEQLRLGSIAQILLAVVLGGLVAWLGVAFLPEATQTMLYESLFKPLFNLFTGLLSGLAGPLVFTSVAWGVCGIGNTAALGRSGGTLLARFVLSIVLSAVISMAVCIPLFPSAAGLSDGGSNLLADIVELVLGLIPTNMVRPFVDGNTSQIIVLAIAIGVASLVMGERSKRIRNAIGEFNEVMMFLIEQLCRFIPGFVFIMIVSQAWSGSLANLKTAWLPAVLIVGLDLLVVALQFVITSVSCRVSLVKIVRACLPVTLMGLTTASSSACLGSMMSTCAEKLGVEKEQVSFGVPLGVVLCKAATAVEIAVFMLFCMKLYGVGVDVTWYIHLGVVSVLYSMVLPPVPGGMIACLGLILAELGIPAEALALLTALDIVLDYPVTASGITITMLNVLGASYKLGCVDEAKLRDPNNV